ncbi:hypothetical protein BJ546DRAFT_844859 [Cryomyces antarcticus]|uniref:CsbD-like domain-containing protein n=1 Tax=Cryomyces antarcticus TaxID=329879 RepID=A0ABR0KUC2_9PEZI|nr:hypothetical protein LTR39_001117 [Cryomyces antarcticus]KAK5020320.1 hypothetical protein LTR60_000625 [Cryomyces antarcticus]KAK5130825.1 hypothetical protein LTR16_001237 [Cryomyces antarcticus]
MASNNNQQPGLIASHVEYIKGAAVGAIGAATGSEAWKQSGEEEKQHGISAMKAASQNRDPATQGYGKVEELAGRMTGCEGMEKEGAESAAHKGQ